MGEGPADDRESVVAVGADGGIEAAETSTQHDDDLVRGRHRRHRSPARTHVMKVLYGDEERAIVMQVAELAGLRPSSFVAVAALRLAQRQLAEPGDRPRSDEADGDANWSGVEDRDVLAELIRVRLALRRFCADVDRVVAAVHSGQEPPPWLAAAVAAAERAVAQVDAAAALVARRLS